MIYINIYIYTHIHNISRTVYFPTPRTKLGEGKLPVRWPGLSWKKTDGRGEMGQITMVFDTEIEENYHLPR